MKLYCLSSHPNKPCHVLTFKENTIMLDCGLSSHSVLNFLPLPLVYTPRLNNLQTWMPRDCSDPELEGELKECGGRVFVDSAPEFCLPLSKLIDYAEVDVILISNYMSMLALPFVTEGSGFDGVVYATEPTLQIGRMYLEELVEYIEQTPKAVLATHWKEMLHLLPSPLSESIKPRSWQQLYNTTAVQNSLARVRMLGYDEKRDVYGSLRVTPVSSGYCLGSSNWIISSDHEKIAYVSGSSTLTTHPKPMDQAALKNSHVLVLTGLTQTPTANPDTMLGELCLAVAMTVRNNGCVLIPCYASGTVYDLFECLSAHLDSSSLSHIPMFFISPVADTSIAYSNILAEWLSQTKQNKVYLPEEPFPHANLVKTGRLKHYKHIYSEGFSADFRQPCIVFCGHPSLRFGDAVHFVELWGSNPQHTIIFTEPDFPYTEALAPFQPVAMKIHHCPIDTSLNFTQANKLIRDLKPQVLILPECYTQPPLNHPQRNDLIVEHGDRKVMTVKRGEVLTLPLKRKREKVQLSPELANELKPVEVKSGINLATLTGVLNIKNNQYEVKVVQDDDDGLGSKEMKLFKKLDLKSKSFFEFGTVDIDQFVQRLNLEGFIDAKVEPGSTGFIIHLQDQDSIIQVEDTSTHIYCGGDQQLRIKLRNILLQCLNKF
uniref:Beta-Casp domain-containing protein n=1 Tax=Clastoptera arizonana TaxID=38151 RepID=A0A1B6CJW2_9HEMI